MKTIRSLLAFIVSMTLSFSAMAQGMCYYVEGARTIYDDAFEPGWQYYTWGNPLITLQSTVAGKSGSAALSVSIQNSTGGGIQIQATGTGPLYTSGHKALTFMLRKEMPGSVTVSLVDDTNSATAYVVADYPYVQPVSFADINATYMNWRIVTIPLSTLQASNITYTGVIFATSGPGTFYLDKIELTNGFLSFPLDCSAEMSGGNCPAGSIDYRTKGAYTPGSVTSVLDHKMTQVYQAEDGTVLAWTGEKGVGPPVNLGCYPKNPAGTFRIYSTHAGGSCLNYDSHPGYDYLASNGTPVKAAEDGIVVNFGSPSQRCIPQGITSAGCDAWGAIGIDHGNGYISQYLHLSRIDMSIGQPVTRGQTIGLSGNKNPLDPNMGYHLHFEVLKKVPGLTAGTYVYKMVDPYGFYADGLSDPLLNGGGAPSFLLWK